MATQPEDDILDQSAEDQDQQDQTGDENQQQDDQGDQDEEEIVFGDDPASPAPDDNSTIRHLRDVIRQKDRQLSERPAPQPKPIEIGPKPDLWEDHDGIVEEYDAAMDQWRARQAAADAQKSDAEKQAEAANKALAEDQEAWREERAKLRVAGKEEAVATVETTLASGTWHPAAFAKLGADAARMEVALAHNPARLAELMAIEDPIKFAIRLGELKGKITVRSNQRAPNPERVTTGNAGVRHGSADKEAERQEKRAMERGGDVSDLLRRNREARRAAQAK